MKKCYFLLILCTLVIAIALMLTACSKRATGPAGPQGSAGLQGTPGAQGAPGPAGSQIFEGDSVPSSAFGNVGDFYINELTDSLYGPKTLSGWGNAISLQGTVGTQGAPGNAGATGAAGQNGAPGQTGAQGPPGKANVIYYNWTSFNVPVWGDFDPTYFRREYSINMPSITSQILDQGVVLVYLEYFMVSNGDTTQQSIDQVPALFYNAYAPTGHIHRSAFADL
jgi:hypothetical protein